MPANGETVTIATSPNIPVDISLGLLKRELTVGTVSVTNGGSFVEVARFKKGVLAYAIIVLCL